MGRKKIKLGYFLHSAEQSTKLKLLDKAFPNEGYAVYFKLLEKIARDGDLCLHVSEAEIEIFAYDWRLSEERLLKIINKAVDVGLFDKDSWDLEQVLLSHEFNDQNRAQINRKNRDTSDHEYKRHKNYIFQRDGYQCVYCGSTSRLSLDHILPLSRGGSNDPDNLATACLTCNLSKSDRTPEEWKGGQS